MKSKLPYILVLAVGVTAALTLSPVTLRGELGASDEAIGVMVDEVAKQQATIVENQGKIDEKLTAVAEEIRQARAFAHRGK
jgi:hypothetical protein